MMERGDGEKCTMEWWKKVIIYQIYPRSFQDSTGNGIGDMQGIISRLEYLSELGVGAIWLSPFYKSPQFDFGYDISDFCSVDPMFGTLQDFDVLVSTAHKLNIKVIIDFVNGHSSHQHEWFQKSVNREEPYSDYYVWHDGKLGPDGQRLPPNNWLSVFGGSSWSWHEKRGQFYYRPFIPQQPKLNYRNPHVVQEMKNVLRFWFDRGVDGIRVDAIHEIVEHQDKSLDEPRDLEVDCPPDEYEYLKHVYTCMQPEGYEVIQEWRDLLDEYSKRDGQSRPMIIETYAKLEQRNLYRKCGGLPFNMDLIDLPEISGEIVRKFVEAEYQALGEGEWSFFALGNHDRHRVSSRVGAKLADALNMLLLTLWGTPTTYYGEELGMGEIDVTFEDTQDPFGKNMGPERYKLYSRDPCRSPMQWDNSSQAGFTTGSRPWLPVCPDYTTINVKSQSCVEGGPSAQSSLTLYKTLARLRQEPAFLYGELITAYSSPELFCFVRQDPKSRDRYLVALNLGSQPDLADLRGSPVNADQGTIVASTCAIEHSMTSGHSVRLDKLQLKPGDGLVIKLDSNHDGD